MKLMGASIDGMASGGIGRGIVAGIQGLHQYISAFIQMGITGEAISYGSGRAAGVALAAKG